MSFFLSLMKAKWRPLVKQEVKEENLPSSPQDYKPNVDSHHGNKMSYRHDFDSDLSPDKNQHKSHEYVFVSVRVCVCAHACVCVSDIVMFVCQT